ncbi:MAG: hypothetical protein HY758_07965 [Nitrospirae bacterium]|nr:hypothetical protein [Nitrospirota bacterium]
MKNLAAKNLLKSSLCIFLALLFTAVAYLQPVSAETTILSQSRIMPVNPSPNDTVGASPYSDVSPESLPLQILAENFVMNSAASISDITLWGGYWWQSAPPLSGDNFTVIFHNDSGGSVGTNIYSEFNVATSRANIGSVKQQWWGGVTTTTEYEYTLTLANPVPLGQGTYWVEVYNNTTGNPNNDWFWRWGNLDAANGIDGLAWTDTGTPGTNWNVDASGNLAMKINAVVPEPVSSSLFIVGGAILGFKRLRNKRSN